MPIAGDPPAPAVGIRGELPPEIVVDLPGSAPRSARRGAAVVFRKERRVVVLVVAG